jgi:hypothetical protein
MQTPLKLQSKAYGTLSLGSAGAQISVICLDETWTCDYDSLAAAEHHAQTLGIMQYATREGSRSGIGMVYSLRLPLTYPYRSLISVGFRHRENGALILKH